jgi:hypothetical protein
VFWGLEGLQELPGAMGSAGVTARSDQSADAYLPVVMPLVSSAQGCDEGSKKNGNLPQHKKNGGHEHQYDHRTQ